MGPGSCPPALVFLLRALQCRLCCVSPRPFTAPEGRSRLGSPGAQAKGQAPVLSPAGFLERVFPAPLLEKYIASKWVCLKTNT